MGNLRNPEANDGDHGDDDDNKEEEEEEEDGILYGFVKKQNSLLYAQKSAYA